MSLVTGLLGIFIKAVKKEVTSWRTKIHTYINRKPKWCLWLGIQFPVTETTYTTRTTVCSGRLVPSRNDNLNYEDRHR